jgi:hypothetical protein
MVAYPLVDKDLDAGRELLRLLAEARIPVSVAFWMYQEESQAWRLAIATPLVDNPGPRQAYERIQAAMSPGFPLNIVHVKALSPNDEFAVAMKTASLQNPEDEYLHFFHSTVLGVPVDDVYVYKVRS